MPPRRGNKLQTQQGKETKNQNRTDSSENSQDVSLNNENEVGLGATASEVISTGDPRSPVKKLAKQVSKELKDDRKNKKTPKKGKDKETVTTPRDMQLSGDSADRSIIDSVSKDDKPHSEMEVSDEELKN